MYVACHVDQKTFCPGLPDPKDYASVGSVLDSQCFKENEERLSSDCRLFLKKWRADQSPNNAVDLEPANTHRRFHSGVGVFMLFVLILCVGLLSVCCCIGCCAAKKRRRMRRRMCRQNQDQEAALVGASEECESAAVPAPIQMQAFPPNAAYAPYSFPQYFIVAPMPADAKVAQ